MGIMNDAPTAVGLDCEQIKSFREFGAVIVQGRLIKREKTRDFLATRLYLGAVIRCYDDQLQSVGEANVLARQWNRETGYYDYVLKTTKVASIN